MRTRRFSWTLASTLALLVAAGCGGSGAGTETVAWTDGVCGALTGFTDVVTTQPQIDPADPVGAVRGVSDYLGSTAEALQRSISALDAVGTSPVDGGDEYVARLRDALTQIRTSFDAARTQLTGLDASNPASLATALPAAFAPLQELHNLPDPTEGLRANDELRAASEQAPNCQQLRSSASAAG
jgi:hypothetical protein